MIKVFRIFFYCLFVLAILSCSSYDPYSNQSYIELVTLNGEEVQGYKIIIDDPLNNYWLGDQVFLNQVDRNHIAIGGAGDQVYILNLQDYKLIAKNLQYNSQRIHRSLWHVAETETVDVQVRELQTSLISRSILKKITFTDSYNLEYETIFELNSERINESKFETNEFISADESQVLAVTTLYDLVVDSLENNIYANEYFKTVKVFEKNQNDNYSLAFQFNPEVPKRYYGLQDYKGIRKYSGVIKNRFIPFVFYNDDLYLYDLHEEITTHFPDQLSYQAYLNDIIIDDKILIMTNHTLQLYEPFAKTTTKIYESEEPMDQISIAFNRNTEKLLLKYKTHLVENSAVMGSRVIVSILDIKSNSSKELYSKEYKSSTSYRLPYSNFIEINGSYYTVTLYKQN